MVCPDANKLSAMVAHSLDPAMLGELELHIDACETCRKAVAVLALGSQPNASEPPAGQLTIDPAIGAALADRYLVESVLGTGGMGRILTAFDRHLKRNVALKELRVQRRDLEARFQHEALLTARLEHPNIVSVHEAGTWPTGEPFYTMRLVSGRPLDQVIAGASELDDRLALLPHLIAVADALAYAHQKRIIHRDLKPQNVMVGEFGETVVIDWGLAKDLSVAREESGPHHGPDSGPGATEVGEVMGTPAYMPPEQAEGEPVDERADVYAIGAVLYHVLAGEPPYTGKSSIDVVLAVRSGPPTPLGERLAGVPADLLAIIDRAMARDPEARYRTARELADDLRRFQTGQLVGAHRYTLGQLARRWLRRHRTPIAVACASLVLLGVFGVLSVQRIVREQHHASAERRLAEKSRAEAEALMDFMLFDMKDKLQPIGKLELLDAVANKATDYYDGLPSAATAEDRHKRAVARRNLGDVLRAKGNLSGALVEYRASLDIVKDLATDVTNLRWQKELAVAHDKIGVVLMGQGQAAAALAEYRAALAIDERLLVFLPTSHQESRVSQRHLKIGDVIFAQGDANAALAEYRIARTIQEKNAAKNPSDEWQRDLAITSERMGEVLSVQGDLNGALAEFRRQLALQEQLTAKSEDPMYQRDLSVAHDKVGDALMGKGDAKAALVEYRASLALAEKFAASDPSNAGWQRDLMVSRVKLGEALRAEGELVEALTVYRAGLALASSLAARDPTNANGQRDLATLHERVGDVLLAQQNPRAALLEFRASLPIKEQLAAKDPTNADFQRDLAVSHTALGDAYRSQGNMAAALAEYRLDTAITEKLAKQDPTNAAWQADLMISHQNLGRTLDATGNGAAASTEFRTALAIADKLVALDGEKPQWKEARDELQHALASCCKSRR